MVSTPWYPLPPPGYGGIEAMAAVLVDALVDRGHDVTVIGVGEQGTEGAFVATDTEAASDRIGQTIPEVLHAARTAQVLRRLEVDVVHDHSTAGPLQARQRRVPTVVTAHGPVRGEMGELYRSIADTVNLVAISSAQQAQAPELAWGGLVHNAVRLDTFPFSTRKRDYVAYLGRLSPEKGAHLAIRAAREAGYPIVLAGPCTAAVDRQYFEEQVAPLLGDDARWIGELQFAEKTELLMHARCLVMPVQWEEPFGMVMIESLACGTPVVALRRGSVPEIVEDGVTGYVRDRPEELSDAILAVDRISPQACRRRVGRCFDVGKMAASYEQIYRQVARRRRVVLDDRTLPAVPVPARQVAPAVSVTKAR